MEEKIRKIFNFSPPTVGRATADSPISTEKNTKFLPLARALSLTSMDENSTVSDPKAERRLHEREEALHTKDYDLQVRESHICDLEKEFAIKLNEVALLDAELKTKIVEMLQKEEVLASRERDLASREEIVSQKEAYIKKKYPHEDWRRSTEFLIVGSAVHNAIATPVYNSFPPLIFDESDQCSDDCEQEEEWIVVTDDGFEDTPPKQTIFSNGLKKITQNFKCNVADCGRVIFVFEPKYKCIRCDSVYCLEHAGLIHSPPPTEQPNHVAPRSPKIDEVTGLCPICFENETQTIGRTRSLLDKFNAARKNAKDDASVVATDRENKVKLSLMNIVTSDFAPVAALSSVLRNNPLKNIVLTNKETWKSCPSCGSFFGKLTMRHVCRLCEEAFCEKCGNKSVEFCPLQLFPYLTAPSSSFNKWQSVEVEICVHCEALVEQKRRAYNFVQNVRKRRSLSSNLSQQFVLYSSLSVMYMDVMSKLEQFVTLVESISGASETAYALQDDLEELLSKFQDHVRLLHTYNYNSNNNTNNNGVRDSPKESIVSPTEMRVLENTKIFFKRELRDAILKFQKYKQLYYYRSHPKEAKN